MTTLIVIVAVLVLLNGLFVAAEFAIVGTPRVAIDKRVAAGELLARRVQGVLEDPRRQDRFIATAQLGITLASLGLGMYSEHQVAERLVHWLEGLGAGRYIAAHTLASIVAVAILTYAHIVFGEMVPKSIALQRAERTVLWITPVMLVIQAVCYPLVLALNALGNLLLRLDRHPATAAIARTPVLAGGTGAHRHRERSGRHAARGVGQDPARAVRVRRPHGA